MAEIVSQLAALESKIEKLISYCDGLESERLRLKEENDSMRETISRQEAELKEQAEKLRVLKLARSVSADSEKTIDIKQKINEFVREIDKCINLLNR